MKLVHVNAFPDQPHLVPSIRDRTRFELLAPVTYTSPILPGGSVTVPAGYLTDGASIPRGFRWIVGQPFTPAFQTATILHDYLYQYTLGTQKNADNLFLEILKHNGVGKGRRYAMWAALRLFGWAFWKPKNSR